MNAFEIVKNIIPDGINQCKESILDRLMIPDFNEPEPKDEITLFKTAEEWLDTQLHSLALEDFQFEKEYYGLKQLMTEDEYFNTSFSIDYKRNFPNYEAYKVNWQRTHSKLIEVERSRQEIYSLLDNNLLNEAEFSKLQLKQSTKLRIRHISQVFDDDRMFEAYFAFWKNARNMELREEIFKECEKWWKYEVENTFGYDTHQKRRKVIEIQLTFVERFDTLKRNFIDRLQKWEEKKSVHLELQTIRTEEINKLEDGYYKREVEYVKSLYTEILKSSKYNFEFHRYIDVDFNSGNRLLLVEYTLPLIENLPSIKETKYLSSKGEYRNILISQSDLLKLFDEAVYSICLRSIYEIFENDPLELIEAVNFNGWVKSINKATGKEENTCIISIQVQRKEFMDIDLERVDPKTCFKHLKGVGSSKLYGITAIKPIIQIQKKDKRFVDSHSVEFDDSTNLAAMPWEDFEHLIRELFEKEFSSNGGEVKVTQASRDGGVDAIAFDPDPIRGGKIVIQAKRYTNTVGVSAVRDLFGTVMNEGANKGILVTTSDYGSDSYEFAKGKPLTLLNGANLLYLLEKHGTRAKIDIKEARRLMNEEK